MALVQSDNLVKVVRTLLNVVPNLYELERLMYAIDADPSLFERGLPRDVATFNLIQWASAHGRLGDLLMEASRDYGDHPELRALAQQLSTRHDAEPLSAPLAASHEGDPFDAMLLPNGLPFLNRQVLRRCLRTMLTDKGRNILVVQGGDGVGKTYTLDFILYLSVALQSFRVSSFDLAASAYVTIEPTELAFHLAAQISQESELPVSPETTSARGIIRLADWLLSKVAQTKASWWFVLDGFDHPYLRPDTLDLLRALLISVARDRRADLKIVLLGCSDDLVPIALGGEVLWDRIEPLQKPDIEEFFSQLKKSGARRFATDQFAPVADAILELGREPRSVNQALIQAMEVLQQDTG